MVVITTTIRRVRRMATAMLVALLLVRCGSVGSQIAPQIEPQPAQSASTPRVPGLCQVPASQRLSEVGCYLTVEAVIGALPDDPLFWHLDTYPTRAAAEAARGPRGVVAESFGRVWLYTIAEKQWRPAAGERVAVIGPLSIKSGQPYTARYMEAVFAPGMQPPVAGHRHSGPEAWYVLTGAQCLETSNGLIIARAGEGALVPEGPPMAISGIGSETRRAVLLVLHPTSEPWSSPAADWKPKGLCPK